MKTVVKVPTIGYVFGTCGVAQVSCTVRNPRLLLPSWVLVAGQWRLPAHRTVSRELAPQRPLGPTDDRIGGHDCTRCAAATHQGFSWPGNLLRAAAPQLCDSKVRASLLAARQSSPLLSCRTADAWLASHCMAGHALAITSPLCAVRFLCSHCDSSALRALRRIARAGHLQLFTPPCLRGTMLAWDACF